ncbi:MAG: response regulator [Terriglobales bacterium]
MNKSVLIVDSSSVMRRVIERSLRLAGIEAQQIYEAAAGDEALSLAQLHQPDLILTEINLAGMEGLSLVRSLRQSGATADLPVVIISSQAGESHVHEALELGVRGYIRKPFTADQVRDYIADFF